MKLPGRFQLIYSHIELTLQSSYGAPSGESFLFRAVEEIPSNTEQHSVKSTFTSLKANNMTVKLTSQVNHQRHKYYSLMIQYHFDSEDGYRSSCRNVSHCHQQFFSELHSPGQSH